MNAILRLYRPEEFETLYAIDQACYPRGIAYSRRTLRWFLSHDQSECILAEIEGEIAGFILDEWEGSRAHIITIDVLAHHRRSGVATALLREAEQRLAARGIRQVELETAQDNDAAIAFWQKHGYRTRGFYRRYYLGRINALAMTKPLARAKVN